MVERIILRKVKNSEELTLDKVSTPDYILGSVEWEPVKGTHHSYKYVNQSGVSITNTSLGTRGLTIEGWIVAKSEILMTSLKSKLNAFINPQEEMTLIYSKYMINFIPDESVKYSVNTAENNEIFCKFQISGTCPNPLFTDDFENRLAFIETAAHFHFPLVMSKDLPDGGVVFGKRTESLIANVYNRGAVSVGMKIVFKANGSVMNPSLVNVVTQERFTINKLLVAGEEIEINTSIGEKSVRGRIDNAQFSNYFMYKDVDSPWLQLEVGDNQFGYEADGGFANLDVFIYFYNRYLEVQECY